MLIRPESKNFPGRFGAEIWCRQEHSCIASQEGASRVAKSGDVVQSHCHTVCIQELPDICLVSTRFGLYKTCPGRWRCDESPCQVSLDEMPPFDGQGIFQLKPWSQNSRETLDSLPSMESELAYINSYASPSPVSSSLPQSGSDRSRNDRIDPPEAVVKRCGRPRVMSTYPSMYKDESQ